MSACREWPKSRNKKGYGQTWHRGTVMLAHRVAWIEAHGEIPEGMLICHTCDNPPCVNVDHLFLGTPQTNMDDRVAKGRYVSAMSSKTHCPSNHPYAGENLRINRKGARECVACSREKVRRHRAKAGR